MARAATASAWRRIGVYGDERIISASSIYGDGSVMAINSSVSSGNGMASKAYSSCVAATKAAAKRVAHGSNRRATTRIAYLRMAYHQHGSVWRIKQARGGDRDHDSVNVVNSAGARISSNSINSARNKQARAYRIIALSGMA